ncbi:MAG: arginase [Alphaproteobacteria bacterium]|nr:arginase [Alphaproteobacteria bacterium]
MKNITFIGSASGWGAQIRETEKGPKAFKESGVLSSLDFPWTWKETLYPLKTSQEVTLSPGLETLPYMEDMCVRMSQSVEETLQQQEFPVVIGGDHGIAMGTWSGVTHHLKAKGEFGLIWIDAHMDAHTLETTPSQAYHGMPLAVLLGFGEDSLVNLLREGPALNPAHICLIGIRSFEEGEAALLKHLGVRVYFMKDVQANGFKAIFEEALDHVKQGTKGFGVSIDLDGFDPTEAPGVGTPEPEGLKAAEVIPALSLLQHDPFFKALEIVEYNTDRDKDNKTIFLMRDLLSAIFSRKEK